MKKSALFLLLLLSLSAYAADVRVSVVDADLEMPLEGAKVETADGRVLEAGSDGVAIVPKEDGTPLAVRVTYPGYGPKRITLGRNESSVTARMTLEGVVESAELVIEARKPGVSDQKVGVSTTVTASEMRTTANIGLVEDVMSTIKALPGVGYTGGWNALPSIRGGEPLELTAVLDGYHIEMPFHWGGAFSIFNPNMVATAKLSNGVFPAKYGNAMSGLLEVTSKTPDPERPSLDLGVTTSALETVASIPFGGSGGLIIGGKLTYWDPFVAVAGLVVKDVADRIAVAPYIRDCYLKGSFRPSSDVELFLNGFFGSDGIAIRDNAVSASLTSTSNFTWANYLAFGTGGIRWNPDSFLLAQLTAGGGWSGSNMTMKSNTDGTISYTEAFRERWSVILGGNTEYSLHTAVDVLNVKDEYTGQARLDVDLHPADFLVLSFGGNEVVQKFMNRQNGTLYTVQDDGGSMKLVKSAFDLDTGGNMVFNSGAYAQASLKTQDDFLTLDLGCRLDHIYVTGKDGFSLQTHPVANPRGNVALTPVKNSGGLERLTLTFGSGLFSRTPVEVSVLNKTFNLKDFEVSPNRNWTSVAGIEAAFEGGFRASLEGYYKQGFNRLYYNQTFAGDPPQLSIKTHFDGMSEIWGLDFMLQKAESRYIDGWITASYLHARYRNPTVDSSDESPAAGPDSGMWYWPSFHRYFNANLIVNVKPVTGFTATARLAFATGKPKKALGTVESYPLVDAATGKILEYWQREDTYSDTERTDFSIPLDLRLSWNWYHPGTKVRCEFYVAGEDVLVNLYSPKGNKRIDSMTGREVADSGAAEFNIGFPMLSIGTKWSY